MTDLPAPSASRLQRPGWRDGRLLIGLLIVLVSVALGARVVAAADDATPVYAAATTLVTGRSLVGGDLVVVRVRLGPVAGSYLGAQVPPPTGGTVLRTLQAGELVPVSAVGPAERVPVRPVTVPLDGTLPQGLVVGSRVDVWSSARDPAGGAAAYRPPVLLADAAEVSAVTAADGGLTPGQGSSVQVMLGRTPLRAVLDATANGARIVLVPVPGGGSREAG